MKRLYWIILGAIAVLGLSGCCCCFPTGSKVSSQVARNIQAGAVQRQTRQVNLDGAKRVKAVIQFGDGRLDVEGGDPELLSGEFLYNLPELEPVIVYDVQGEQGVLDVRHESQAIPWDRLAREVRNEWQLRLTDRVPLDLDIAVGASDGKLQLGGLQLTSLGLTAGAADMVMSFASPNPERLGSLHIRSGAAKLELLDLGNANLDELTFDGGTGTYTFDFRGDWKRSARADIRAGASHVSLRIPQDIGVRVCPGDLRRGDYDGLLKQDDCYVNQLYGQSDINLDISLDLGLGKLDIN
jgi:hypothetical protein